LVVVPNCPRGLWLAAPVEVILRSRIECGVAGGSGASMAHIAGGAPTARSLRGKCVKSTLTEPPLSGREKMLPRSWITKRRGGRRQSFAELWRGPLGGRMACHTVVEDLTAAGLQDDECIEVRAVTTVKRSVANHRRVVPNEGQSRRILSRTGFRGPGTSAAGSVRLECRASVPAARARVDRMGISAGWFKSMRTRSMITR
jgi:hypothetical protein